jgi:hypothetical protein
MAVGAVLIVIFLVYDQSRKSPTIDFPSFKNKVLRNSVAPCFYQFRILGGYLLGNHIPAGNKGTFAAKRILTACAWICGWKIS